MTDATPLAALERVAAAVRVWAAPLCEAPQPWPARVQQLLDAIAALDAIRALEPTP